MFHKLRILLGLLSLLAASMVVYTGWIANRSTEMPSHQELQATLEKGISWLEMHQENVLADPNPALWWMLKDSAELTGDIRLRDMVDAYLTKMRANTHNSPFMRMVDPESPVRMSLALAQPLADYNYYILYGMTCDSSLAVTDVVLRYSRADMCGPLYLLKPVCVTHQLMGARFVYENGCGDVEKTAGLITELQSMVATRQSMDARVDDGYLQGVMMLAATGGYRHIKPAWVRNVMAAQRPDGGWEASRPWLPVGGSRYVEISRDGITVNERSSGFHPTAQGVFFISLMLNQANDLNEPGQSAPPSD